MLIRERLQLAGNDNNHLSDHEISWKLDESITRAIGKRVARECARK